MSMQADEGGRIESISYCRKQSAHIVRPDLASKPEHTHTLKYRLLSAVDALYAPCSHLSTTEQTCSCGVNAEVNSRFYAIYFSAKDSKLHREKTKQLSTVYFFLRRVDIAGVFYFESISVHSS